VGGEEVQVAEGGHARGGLGAVAGDPQLEPAPRLADVAADGDVTPTGVEVLVFERLAGE
jgi:hypothetical protein